MTSPADVCECGDGRKSHILGRGACRVCRWATRYWEPCQRFRFARKGESVADVTRIVSGWEWRQRAEAAEAEIARLRAALQWYADPTNHDRGRNIIPSPTNAMADRGERARAALSRQNASTEADRRMQFSP